MTPERKDASGNHAAPGTEDLRAAVCRRLALGGPAQVHQLIVGAMKHPETLLQRGLNAKTLVKLGYDGAGMKRLGFDERALQILGFSIPKPAVATPEISTHPATAAPETGATGPLRPLPPDDPVLHDGGVSPELKALLARGMRALELRAEGWQLMDCKRAGVRTGDLIRFGFTLGELAGVCTAAELRREGYGIRELKKFYSSHQLREAGYSATDMRIAGYNIRELLALGYNENHIRTAGFSNIELMREGLNRTTRQP